MQSKDRQALGRSMVLCGLILGGMTAAEAQLNVAQQTDLQELASTITGQGVSISNPQINCASQGYGEFTYSGSLFGGVTEGVILTSGRIEDAIGPNDAENTSYQPSTGGDPLLNIVTGRTTYNACKFEFDVIPSGDTLHFDFVFGSEEYNEWVGSQYNDVFGFFISGPGISGDPGAGNDHNIALVPNTSTPVTINNVNNGSNSNYYHDNAGGADIQYDGFTQGLYAESTVQACETYHLKLIVADASDKKFDSGVFIAKVHSPTLSLSTYTANGGPDLIEACNPGWIRFSRANPRPTPLMLQYYLQGTATNGTDYQQIGSPNPNIPKNITIPANQTFVDRPVDPLFDVINEGTESIHVVLGNPDCPSTIIDSLTLYIRDSLFTDLSPGGTICIGGSWPFTITGGSSFAWSPATGLSCTDCADPVASPTTTTNYTVTVTDGSCSKVFHRTVKVSDLTLSAMITAPLCEGQSNGAINLSVSNGQAPYTYSWTGPNGFTASTQDISGIPAGTYSVTVTDAACTRSQSFVVSGPQTLAVALDPSILAFGQNVSCFGGHDGAIDATITGGTGPYTVTWTGPNGFSNSNEDINGLYAGPYTVNITDAHGCSTSASTTLTETNALDATISNTTDVTCSGDGQGSATVDVNGGIPPYTYAWNTIPVQTGATASPLTPASYTVTVTDTYGCTASATSTIGGPTQALQSTVVGLTNVACHGDATGSADLSVNGGTPPYDVQWNTVPVQSGSSASGLTAGTWTATVTDANGCSTTRDVTITEPTNALNVVLFDQQDVQCFGGSTGSATAQASGGTGAYTYSWNTSPAQTAASAVGLDAGTHSVTVHDANGCSSALDVIIAGPAAALSATIDAHADVACHGGNDGTAHVTVSGGTTPYSYSWNTTPVQTTATASGLNAGTRTVTVTDANGCSTMVSVTIAQPSALTIAGNVTPANCQGAADGAIDVTIAGGTPPYAYAWTGPDGFVAGSEDISTLVAGGYALTVTDAHGCTTSMAFDVNQPGLFSISSTVSDHNGVPVSCGSSTDGAIDMSVSGATPPYDFAWTGPNGFSAASEDVAGLGTGQYQFTVTDANGCSTSQSFELTSATAMSIDLSAVLHGTAHISCNGGSNGSIDASITGGIPPYVFDWTGPGGFTSTNEDLSSLAAGGYDLIVTDANGCGSTGNIVITQPAPVIANMVGTTAQTCYGSMTGSATAAAAGGNAPYTFSWNTTPVQTGATATGLTAGFYSVTVTDNNGCTAQTSTIINGPAAPLVLTVTTVSNALCHGGAGGSASVNATGGTAPYQISWNTTPPQTGPTATGLAAGSYTATVVDTQGCTSSVNVQVSQPTAPISAFVEDLGEVSCFGAGDGYATFDVTGGSGSYTVEWNTVPVQFGPTATGLAPGQYWITITDNNGCGTTKQYPVTIDGPTAPVTVNAMLGVFGGGFNVSCADATDGSIDITTTGGTAPYYYQWSDALGNSTGAEDLSGLEPGTFDLVVTDAHGCVFAQQYELTAPPAISTTASITTAACQGSPTGAVDATISGGVGPYSPAWTGPNGFTANTTDIMGLASGVYQLQIIDANGCHATGSFDVSEPGSIAATATLDSHIGGWGVSCANSNDGAIDLSASGGTPPLAYLWSGPNGFTSTGEDLVGITAGTYHVTITDANGCTTLSSYSVTAPPAMGNTLVATTYTGGFEVSCNGSSDGAIDATITGGTLPYSVSWNGPNGFSSSMEDITGLTAGAYAISVNDANGCATTGSVTLDQAPPLTSTQVLLSYDSGDNIACAGGGNGAIDLTVSGGLAPYSTAWTGPNGFSSTSTDLNGLVAGSYSVAITDAAGCTTNASATLTEPAPINVSALTASYNGGYATSCAGTADGSIALDVSGGAGNFQVQWTGPDAFASNSEDVAGLAPGTYQVTITDDNGCAWYDAFTLNAPPALHSSAVPQTALCNGSNDGAIALDVSGGVGPYSYFWSGPAAFSSTDEDPADLFAGVYFVTITDANGCVHEQSVDVTEPGAFQVNGILSTYPGGYNITCAGASDGSIAVSASGGTPPYYYAWNGPGSYSAITDDIDGITTGTYDLTLTDQNGCQTLRTYTISGPTPVHVGLVPALIGNSNVSCTGAADGSIDALVAGGVQPYVFSWNGPNGFSATSEDVIGLTSGAYTLVVNDLLGCNDSATITLNGPAPLDLTLDPATYPGGGNVSCGDASDGAIDLAVSGGNAPYNVHWTGPNGFQSSAPSISGLFPGLYTVTVNDANGCSESAQLELTNPDPIAIDALLSQYGNGNNVPCQGSMNGSIDITVTGGGSGYGYAWTGPNGFSSSDADLNGLAAGPYLLTVTDVSGCSASASITITQPTTVGITGTLSDVGNGYQVGCAGNDGAIDISASGGTTPYQFAWTGTGGFASSDEDLSALQAGVYQVSITDANGCTANGTYTLTQAGDLNAVLDVSGNVCNGLDDGAIDLTITGGVAPYTTIWSGPNGFNSNSEDVSALSGGPYTVQITDANNCGTQQSATIAASTPMGLTAYVSSYGGVNIPCSGDSTGVIEVNISGGALPLTMSWTGPNGFTSNASTLGTLLAGDYQLSVTDVNGCPLDTLITLTEPASAISGTLDPFLFASGTNISCHGASDGLVDLAVSGGTGPYTFDWRGPDSTNYDTEDLAGAPAGAYELVIIDANQCTHELQITLTEPDSTIGESHVLSQYVGGANTSCSDATDGSIDLSANGGNGGFTFNWTGPNGFTATDEDIQSLIAGGYTVTITDTNGCALVQTIALQAPPFLDAVLEANTFPGGTNISCQGSSDGAISSNISGGTPGYQTTWTGPNGFTTTIADISGLLAGTYCLAIMDTNGCATQSCIDLIGPDALQLSATSEIASCGSNNGSIDLTVTGGSPDYAYDWDGSGNSEDLGGLAAGMYVVTVTDANGCVAGLTATVESTPGVDAAAVVMDALCYGSDGGAIDLETSSGTAPFMYAWDDGSDTEDLSDLHAGTYSVTITDANGCTWSDSYVVGQSDELLATATANTFPNGYNVSSFHGHDGAASVNVQGGVPPYSFAWSNGANTSTTTGLSAGSYQVTITDANGCSISLEILLEEPQDLIMPTGFSPNGDGMNDAYVVQGLDAYARNEMVVLNRWGNKVYERLNYRNDWNGENLQGQPLPDGTYFVILRINNGAIELQDYVDLRR
ncbi:MAG: choice-of-anchor L domain-containing protein [Flavobacteriales bacterium]|nr:choice-of-anchor L domain-containing protein [Flavobacteriales bacterium]